jgi:hypothetical protein
MKKTKYMKLILKKWSNPKNNEIRTYVNTADHYKQDKVEILKAFYLNENKEVILDKRLDPLATNMTFRYKDFFKERNLEIPKTVSDAVNKIVEIALTENK